MVAPFFRRRAGYKDRAMNNDRRSWLASESVRKTCIRLKDLFAGPPATRISCR